MSRISGVVFPMMLKRNKMEPQEVFNKIVKHLRKQKRASRCKDGGLYFSPNGDKCSTGCLMEDGEYRDQYEGLDMNEMIAIAVPSLHDRLFPHVELLCEIQEVHDNHDPCEWEDDLASVANEFDLLMPKE